MTKLNPHPLLCFLSEQEIMQIKAVCRVETYVAHENLISIGNRSRDIICLEEGSVSVQVEDLDGLVHEVARIHQGNLVGEMNFIIPTRRTANVVALTEIVAEIFPYDRLCALLKEQPNLACKIFAALNLQLKDKFLGMIG